MIHDVKRNKKKKKIIPELNIIPYEEASKYNRYEIVSLIIVIYFSFSGSDKITRFFILSIQFHINNHPTAVLRKFIKSTLSRSVRKSREMIWEMRNRLGRMEAKKSARKRNLASIRGRDNGVKGGMARKRRSVVGRWCTFIRLGGKWRARDRMEARSSGADNRIVVTYCTGVMLMLFRGS